MADSYSDIKQQENIKAALKKELDTALRYLETELEDAADNISGKYLLEALFQLWDEASVYASGRALYELGETVSTTALQYTMRPYIETVTMKKAKELTKTVKKDFRRVVADEIGRITTEYEQRTNLKKLRDEAFAAIKDKLDGYADWQSRRIAVTETTSAKNYGTHSAASEIEKARGEKVAKVWIAHRGARPAHAAAHYQTVLGKDTPFIVDGEALQYPADPSGSAGNVINCRCELRLSRPSDVEKLQLKQQRSPIYKKGIKEINAKNKD